MRGIIPVLVPSPRTMHQIKWHKRERREKKREVKNERNPYVGHSPRTMHQIKKGKGKEANKKKHKTSRISVQ